MMFIRPILAAAMLVLFARLASARVEGEAFIGRPFGVGQITLTGADAAIDANRVFIEEKNGRVFYPAISQGAFGRILGQILGDPTDRPATNITIQFLFRGVEPLELTVFTPQRVPVVVQPRAENPRRFERELAQWWRQYNAFWRGERAEDNHPPLLSTYLTAMLAQRLGQEPPLVERRQAKESSTTTTESLELMLGMERLRLDTLKNTLQGRGDFGVPADLPLPPGPAWAPLALPAELPAVEIEPIALHVPHEWFYVRFGQFANYLWLNHLLEEYGGDISSMVTLRSYLAPMNKRVQNQLGLEQNLLGELLGGQVISDVALVGRDTFTREGAAIGILFQAKNSDILKNDLMKQRQRALDRVRERGGADRTFEIAGREVSFFSTPDNRLRSFYAADGDFHLVTTSRAMVERFLKINEGPGALGNSPEFRSARQEMPTSRGDTVFVYFSSAFFEGLFSPHYQVELERRMKSLTDIELYMLARLAARGEGLPAGSPEELAAAGLLPRGFGRRPDGSAPVLVGDEVQDSRRGARGAFTPIADVQVSAITRGEAGRLAALNAQLAANWRRMDPLLIGIHRTALNDAGLERVVLDGNISPLDETKYGWLISILGPPSRQMVTPAAGDVVAVQAAVRGGAILPRVGPHYLFLGIQDIPPLGEVPTSGLMQTLNLLRATPGYLGSWPRAGFLDILPFNLGGTIPDPNGFSRLPFGLWRRQGNGFSVLSFDPALLAAITPQLRVVDSEVEAQIRMHVEDLSQSKIRPWILSLYYQRGLAASAGNARFMMLLAQQLHVPLSQAKATAEDLLDARLSCPLGGEYEMIEDIRGGLPEWQSTAWAERSATQIPADFEAPLLKWFRGLDAHLTKVGNQITTRIELDMQRQPTAPKLEIPLLNFGKLFGGGQKALQPKPGQNLEELPPPLPPVNEPPGARTPSLQPPGLQPKRPEPPKNQLPGAREI